MGKLFIKPGKKLECPECMYTCSVQKTIREHCRRVHGMGATFKVKATVEELRSRQRGYERKFCAKQTARIRVAKSLNDRMDFNTTDADTRGVYQAADPIVCYGPSSITGAGSGVFACVPLRDGDVVTRCEGDITVKKPSDPEYAIQVDSGTFFDAIRRPIVGKGIASFVNRESRDTSTNPRCYKNCEIVSIGQSLYVQVTKNIPKGRELFTTYSRGYRLKK